MRSVHGCVGNGGSVFKGQANTPLHIARCHLRSYLLMHVRHVHCLLPRSSEKFCGASIHSFSTSRCSLKTVQSVCWQVQNSKSFEPTSKAALTLSKACQLAWCFRCCAYCILHHARISKLAVCSPHRVCAHVRTSLGSHDSPLCPFSGQRIHGHRSPLVTPGTGVTFERC